MHNRTRDRIRALNARPNPESAVTEFVRKSPDIDSLMEAMAMRAHQLWQEHGATPFFCRDEVEAFVAYCMSAVRDAPDVQAPETGITYEKAVQLTYRQELFHKTARDSRGRPSRARVNGKVKTWKRLPGQFEVPLKYGLNESFRLYSEVEDASWNDPSMWCETEEEATTVYLTANDLVAHWKFTGSTSHALDRTVSVQLVFRDLSVVVRDSVDPDHNSYGIVRTKRLSNGQVLDPFTLDEWKASSRWELEERGSEHRGDGVLTGHSVPGMRYVGEVPPWQVVHAPTCELKNANPNMRHCTCGAFSGVPR